MQRERSAVVGLFLKEYSQGAILRVLKLPPSQRKLVHRTIRRWKETGGVEDRVRPGRPCSVTTPRLKKVVQQRIRRIPRRSMSKLAVEMKVSRCSIAKVVKRDLGMKYFKRKKMHFISQIVKEKRLARCKGVLGLLAVENLGKICPQMKNYSPSKKLRMHKMREYLQILLPKSLKSSYM